MKVLFLICFFSAVVSTSFAATPQFKPRKDIATGFQRLGGVAVADFNGDGRLDVAAVDMYGIRLVVYLNDGTGSFSTPVSTLLNLSAGVPTNVVAADFDEDKKTDLLITPYSGVQPAIYLKGNGDGTFIQQAYLSGDKGFVVAAAVDINRDSHLDLLTAGSYVNAFLGDGHGNLQAQDLSNQGRFNFYSSIATADINKDGKLDFAVAAPAVPSNIRIFLGNGDGTFAAPTILSAPTITPPYSLVSAPGSLDFADFNGDGNPDLVYSTGFFAYLCAGDGSGTFDLTKGVRLPSPEFSVTVPTTNNTIISPYVKAVDLNGDNKPDIVAANAYITSLAILTNDGAGDFTKALSDLGQPIDVGTLSLDTPDLNGDGLPDIVLGNNSTQNISIFLSIRPKTTSTPILTSSNVSAFVSSSVSFTVKLQGTNNVVPTGNVTLMEGTTSLSQQMLDANGQAVVTLSNLLAGQHTLTAAYAGDTNYDQATSAAFNQTITDMQLAFTTPSQTVTGGGSATYGLTVTPSGGLSGTVTLSCSQLPSLATCDPVTIMLSGQPATGTLNIRTTAPIRSQNTSSRLALLFSPLLVAGFSSRRRRSIVLVAIAIAFSFTMTTMGCSSAASSTIKAPVVVTPGTPTGSTTFTVTATITSGVATLTRTATGSLIVQ